MTTYSDPPADMPTTLPEWDGDVPYISDYTAVTLTEALGMDYVIETASTPAPEASKS